jgi:5-methylcytosine-specific restriction endonuclease McrA
MAIDYSGFAFEKPQRRALTKPREDRADAKERTKVIKAVFARDGFKCRCCGYDANLHPHELVYRSAGGSIYETSNVVTLCNLCHLEGEHGKIGAGKTLHIGGRDANKVLTFTGPWIEYIAKYRARAGRRTGGGQ